MLLQSTHSTYINKEHTNRITSFNISIQKGKENKHSSWLRFCRKLEQNNQNQRQDTKSKLINQITDFMKILRLNREYNIINIKKTNTQKTYIEYNHQQKEAGQAISHATSHTQTMCSISNTRCSISQKNLKSATCKSRQRSEILLNLNRSKNTPQEGIGLHQKHVTKC